MRLNDWNTNPMCCPRNLVFFSSGSALISVGLYYLFPDQFRVSTGLIVGIVAVLGAIVALTLGALVRSRAHGPLSGEEAIRSRIGRVDEWAGPEGWVIVDGERWRARSKTPLSPGDRIKVVEVNGLVLIVKRAAARSGRGIVRRVQESR